MFGQGRRLRLQAPFRPGRWIGPGARAAMDQHPIEVADAGCAGQGLQLPAPDRCRLAGRGGWRQALALQPGAAPEGEAAEPGGAPEALGHPPRLEPRVVAPAVGVEAILIAVEQIGLLRMGRPPGGQPDPCPRSQYGIGRDLQMPVRRWRRAGGRGSPRAGERRLEATAPEAIGGRAQSSRQPFATEQAQPLIAAGQGADPGLARQGLPGRPECGGGLTPATGVLQQLGGGEGVPAEGGILAPAGQLQGQGRLRLPLSLAHSAQQMQGAGMAVIRRQAGPERGLGLRQPSLLQGQGALAVPVVGVDGGGLGRHGLPGAAMP